LFLEALSELLGWGFRVAINSGGDGALVSKISGDSSLVLLLGSSDEGGVEDQTILWSLSLGLQSSEKSFFGTEDLDGGGWVLGQVGKSTSVRNKLGTNDVTDQSRQVWSDSVHSLGEVLGKRLSEIDELNTSSGELFDLNLIGL